MSYPIYDKIALNGPTRAEWEGLIRWAAAQLRAGRTATGVKVAFPPADAITCRSCCRVVQYVGSRRCSACGKEL